MQSSTDRCFSSCNRKRWKRWARLFHVEQFQCHSIHLADLLIPTKWVGSAASLPAFVVRRQLPESHQCLVSLSLPQSPKLFHVEQFEPCCPFEGFSLNVPRGTFKIRDGSSSRLRSLFHVEDFLYASQFFGVAKKHFHRDPQARQPLFSPLKSSPKPHKHWRFFCARIHVHKSSPQPSSACTAVKPSLETDTLEHHG